MYSSFVLDMVLCQVRAISHACASRRLDDSEVISFWRCDYVVLLHKHGGRVATYRAWFAASAYTARQNAASGPGGMLLFDKAPIL